MSRLLDDAVGVGRRIAGELRPGVLDDLGLAAALRWLAREFERRSGLAITVVVPDELPVDDEIGTAAFRIAQEALTNVSRHASASAVGRRAAISGGVRAVGVREDGREDTAADGGA